MARGSLLLPTMRMPLMDTMGPASSTNAEAAFTNRRERASATTRGTRIQARPRRRATIAKSADRRTGLGRNSSQPASSARLRCASSSITAAPMPAPSTSAPPTPAGRTPARSASSPSFRSSEGRARLRAVSLMGPARPRVPFVVPGEAPGAIGPRSHSRASDEGV